jgi:hypothetical protein
MVSIDLVGEEIALALPSWCMISCWKDTWRSSFNFDLRYICLARRARQREVEAGLEETSRRHVDMRGLGFGLVTDGLDLDAQILSALQDHSLIPMRLNDHSCL